MILGLIVAFGVLCWLNGYVAKRIARSSLFRR
jgi:hypothetical protein